MKQIDIAKFATLAKAGNFKLTPLRQRVLEILVRAQQPISAYNILAQLKQRHRAAQPPTVYRVLEFFEEKKIIHRLKHINRYVLCAIEHSKDCTTLVLVCRGCGKAEELIDHTFSKQLASLEAHYQFTITNPVLELDCICWACQKNCSKQSIC